MSTALISGILVFFGDAVLASYNPRHDWNEAILAIMAMPTRSTLIEKENPIYARLNSKNPNL